MATVKVNDDAAEADTDADVRAMTLGPWTYWSTLSKKCPHWYD